MTQFFRIFFAVFLVFSTVRSERPKGSQGIKKPLPLDGVPGVVLKNRTNTEYLPDRVIVKMMPQVQMSLSKSSTGVRAIDQILSHVSVVSVEQMFPQSTTMSTPQRAELSLFYAVTFSSPNDPFTVAEQLSELNVVQYAEPWFIYRTSETAFTPNDPDYLAGLQWGLQKINAAAAWDYSQGDASIVIGIVDTGMQWDHPDLAANIWSNPGEIAGDGIDNDGNGYVDDVRGWDFVGADYATWLEDNNPMPTAIGWHGTHVAGIASAVTNNATGIASIGFRCRILPVKVSADNDNRPGGPYILRGYTGIVYAALMGAKVINCSWGGGGGSQFEQDIINIATQQGSLVVAAAGNGNSASFFSPSGYTNVLSVGATNASDVKSNFTNFGETVDVSSPGENILSTMYSPNPPETYVYASGTSMASPLVAGLAGLVRWKFPSLLPVQAGEQIRVTSDNIDALNPSFAGNFGHGRINALKALTDSTLPSVRMLTFSISDSLSGNGDGQAQPAETLDVTCNFVNYLRPTSDAAGIQLASVNGFITLVNSAFPISSLGTMSGISRTFRIFVNQNVPQSFNAIFQLTFTDGSFAQKQRFSFLINPTYATHSINAIQVSLTNNGNIGFFDFPQNALGVGFVFNGVNHLFEGGLLLGTSSTQLVDVVRNELGGQNADFSSTGFFTLKTPGNISHQDGHTTFTDATSASSIGLDVDLDSFTFSNAGDDKYIILSYTMKNTTSQTISNLYAGIFLDWDIGDYAENISDYDVSRSLGYAYEVGPAARREYLGIRALNGAASFRSLRNEAPIDLTRVGKWDWISGGFSVPSAGPFDIHQVISSGPFQISPGASQKVGFALVAGDSSLANIQQNADAAKAKWDAILNPTDVKEPGTTATLEFKLGQNYPNPFNPATTFEFQIHRPGYVSLKIFDLLGREVAKVVDGTLNAGSHRSLWNAHGLPSGTYFYQLRFSDADHHYLTDIKKLVLIR
ncbi:MAG: S8 family serine peptidase [Ignavibacteriales bacterium]|nr:S8 family serine peptidase [Ignavibacteriales bacterium]